MRALVTGGAGFIESHLAALVPPALTPAHILEAAADFIVHEHREGDDPWEARDGFRLGGARVPTIEFLVEGKRVLAEARGCGVSVARLASGSLAVMDRGETFVVEPYDPFTAAEAAGASTDRVVTPMPGKIIQVLVTSGETVKEGQPLAILEAMKMEHTLTAPGDATVASVEVVQGDQVVDGAVVVRFQKEQEKAA